jgi:iron complex outermembrane recepter protein
VGKSKFLWAASMALALLPATMAYAQGAPTQGDDTAGIEEVVVTAQFQRQNLQDTPISITAVTGETLAERGITTLDNVGKLAPNVNISTTSAVHGPAAAVYIRGIGQYDSNPAFEPGVGIYFDDVYHGALNGSFAELFDIERVEILRGPQGTLSGKNSIGGSVKIFTKKPSADGGGYAEVSHGTDNKIIVRGAMNMSVVPDKLFLRVSGMHKRQDGYVDLIDYGCAFPGSGVPIVNASVKNRGCKWGTLGGKDVSGAAAALRWLPVDGWDVTLSGDLIRDNSEVVALRQFKTLNARFVSPDPFTNYASFKDPASGEIYPNVSAVDNQGLSLNIDGELTKGLSTKSITSYRKMIADYSNDQDGSPLDNRLNYNHMIYSQFSQELRLSGKVGEAADWTIGGYYFDSKNNLANRVASGAFFNFNNNDFVDQTSKSAFAHLIVHPMADMNLTAGLRYTDDDKSYVFHQYAGSGTTPTAQDGRTAAYVGDNFDYRLGIDYRFSPELMVYGQYSTGYKGGGTNPRPIGLTQILPFNPESLGAYEIGLKSDLLDRTLRVNISAFLNNYKDIILIDTSACCGPPGGPGWAPFAILPKNAGSADIKGIEAEIVWEPIPRLQFAAAGGILDFKYTGLTGAIAGPAPGIAPFITPYTAEFTGNASVSYAIELGNGSQLTPRLDLTHQSKMFAEPSDSGNSYIAPITLLNAGLGWKSPDGDWQTNLNVNNLANKTYYTSAFDAFVFSSTVQHAMGREREWTLTVRRQF